MSHYTCLVIGNDPEKLLAPYDENIEVAPYKHKDQEELTTYNPNSKWDWYSLGGRWSAFFKTKEGQSGIVGEPGVFGDRGPTEGRADAALKSDIDFEGMIKSAEDNAREEYRRIKPLIKDLDVLSSFEDIQKKLFPNTPEDEIERDGWDKVRKAYHEQPIMKALRENKASAPADHYMLTEDEFVELHGIQSFLTYGMITEDGVWHAQGRMGWFGTSTDVMTDLEWARKVKSTIDALPDDTLISLFDLHI